jgi:hypothetical protein
MNLKSLCWLLALNLLFVELVGFCSDTPQASNRERSSEMISRHLNNIRRTTRFIAVMVKELTRNEYFKLAMETSHRMAASSFGVVMAKADRRQALVGYWGKANQERGGNK